MGEYSAILIGNPNAGKTTLFNSLTKSNEHVGNFHGVTVSEKEKEYVFENDKVSLIDLPGTYSLTSFSQEECVTRDYIFNHNNAKILNLCDENSLRKSLYLTLNLLEYGGDVLLVINRVEKAPIYQVNSKKLSGILNIDVLEIDAKDKGDAKSLNKLIKKKRRTRLPDYAKKLNLTKIKQIISKFFPKDKLDFFAIKVLEKDERVLQKIPKNVLEKLQKEIPKNSIEVVAKIRYQFIDEILNKCTKKQNRIYGRSKLDKILLNKFLALPIFLCFMACIFYITFFSVGKWISNLLVLTLNGLITKPIISLLTSSFGKSFWAVSLLNNAVFGGVGTILSFLPQIALLFMFLNLLEDSGYLSRIAFLFEDALSKVGLSGKSVYTLLMGFGCSSSAIMTSRTMQNKNAKTKVAIITPYLSCSAKLPIYAVIGGAFLGINNIFLIMALYLLGIIVAIFLSFIFDKTILKSKESFMLEFPAYKAPSLKSLFKVMLTNMRDFLLRVGLVLISMNVVIWVLSNFSFSFEFLNGRSGSMLESIGKTICVLFVPLGFSSWGNVSALLAGVIAKEAVVSSIVLFNGQEMSIQESLMLPSSPAYFSGVASAVSFLVFSLLYIPCVTSMAMLKKEVGLKWTIFAVLTQFLVAYLLSFLTFNLFKFFELYGCLRTIFSIFAVVGILICVVFVIKRVKRKNICIRKCSGCNKCLK